MYVCVWSFVILLLYFLHFEFSTIFLSSIYVASLLLLIVE